MIYWKCKNKECEEYGKKILETKPMFKYTDRGTEPINIPYCKKCGKEMGYEEILPKQEGPINISFGKFNSMSTTDKASVLKKRYRDNLNEKELKHTIEQKRLDATKKYLGIDS